MHHDDQNTGETRQNQARRIRAEDERAGGKRNGGQHGADRGDAADIRGDGEYGGCQQKNAPVQHQCDRCAGGDGLTAPKAEIQREAVPDQCGGSGNAHGGLAAQKPSKPHGGHRFCKIAEERQNARTETEYTRGVGRAGIAASGLTDVLMEYAAGEYDGNAD